MVGWGRGGDGRKGREGGKGREGERKGRRREEGKGRGKEKKSRRRRRPSVSVGAFLPIFIGVEPHRSPKKEDADLISALLAATSRRSPPSPPSPSDLLSALRPRAEQRYKDGLLRFGSEESGLRHGISTGFRLPGQEILHSLPCQREAFEWSDLSWWIRFQGQGGGLGSRS
uniref:Uncharacterized protein LOC105060912 isoform X1 n=1 Tax=Elaeis guineensis var. tenera TaxID=51953 RepID=A0A6I9SHS8_ELAGV|nr:uncharacterized protein LOC105060912 isoform X1 [Elaeis guineensis]